jgi:predicted amidohydrolase YtcJ
MAMRIAGLDARTPERPGGRIARRADGSPSGLFYEEAGELVRRHIPPTSLEELVEAVKEAQVQAHRLGITAIHDFDPADILPAYQILRESGELSLRVTKSIHYSRLDQAISFGLRSGLGDEDLRIGALKLYMGGATE